MQKLQPRSGGLARKQRQRFHPGGMQTRDLDRVFYAQHSCATGANDIAVDPGLRNQIVECRFEVLRPPLLRFFRVAVAFAMPAAVDCENAYASRCQLSGHTLPGLARAIALMKQQHAGAGLSRGEIGSFEQGTIGRFQIDRGAQSRRVLCEKEEAEHYWQRQNDSFAHSSLSCSLSNQ